MLLGKVLISEMSLQLNCSFEKDIGFVLKGKDVK